MLKLCPAVYNNWKICNILINLFEILKVSNCAFILGLVLANFGESNGENLLESIYLQKIWTFSMLNILKTRQILVLLDYKNHYS